MAKMDNSILSSLGDVKLESLFSVPVDQVQYLNEVSTLVSETAAQEESEEEEIRRVQNEIVDKYGIRFFASYIAPQIGHLSYKEQLENEQFNRGYDHAISGMLHTSEQLNVIPLSVRYKEGYMAGLPMREAMTRGATANKPAQEEVNAEHTDEEWEACEMCQSYHMGKVDGYAEALEDHGISAPEGEDLVAEDFHYVSGDYAEGYADGLQNLDRDFENDEEPTDAYIDGYQDGQREANPEEEAFNVTYDDLHVSADTLGHITIPGLGIVLDYPQASLLAERLFDASEYVQSQLSKGVPF